MTIGDSLARENAHYAKHHFGIDIPTQGESMTEQETSRDLVVPATGEVISLSQPSDILAEAAQRMRELEQELARIRAVVGDELIRRLDHENLRSADVGDYRITADAPGGVDWDTDELEQELSRLVELDVISEDAMNRVLPVKRRVALRELKKLLPAVDEDYRKDIESCSEPSSRARRIRVERIA
jgi:hypothetical protein